MLISTAINLIADDYTSITPTPTGNYLIRHDYTSVTGKTFSTEMTADELINMATSYIERFSSFDESLAEPLATSFA